MRLLGNDLHLVKLKLDGGLAAKHGHDDADLVLLDVDQIDDANEAGKRTFR